MYPVNLIAQVSRCVPVIVCLISFMVFSIFRFSTHFWKWRLSIEVIYWFLIVFMIGEVLQAKACDVTSAALCIDTVVDDLSLHISFL